MSTELDEYRPTIHDGFLANSIVHEKENPEHRDLIEKQEEEIVELIIKGYFQIHDNMIRDNAVKALNRYWQFLIYFKNKYPYMSFNESENQTTQIWIESELFKLQNHYGDWKGFWRFILKWLLG